MPQKRKWLFLVLIFTVSLSIVGGVFFLRYKAINETPSAAIRQTVTPKPAASEGIIQQDIQPAILSALGDIHIEPLSVTDKGVAVDSRFLIEPAAHVSRDQLENSLSVKTGEAFVISDSADAAGAFDLVFAAPLSADRIYNFIYAPEGKHPVSYAFQTAPGFTVVSSAPGFDNEYDIPVNADIKIIFSETPEEGWERYFSIDPPVRGTFSIDGQTAIFTPESLKYYTRYTVAIDSGLTDQGGNRLDRAYAIVFVTERSTGSVRDIILYDDVYESFLPNEDIIIRFLLSERYKTQEFSVGVYEFPDPIVFADYFLVNKTTVSGSLNQLENITTGLFVPAESTTAPFDAYLSLGPLPEGYYLVHVSAGDVSVNKLIQVNRLSVYSLSIAGDMCVWVNDTSTGKPAAGASINKQNDRSITDLDGIAKMHIKSSDVSPITIQYRDTPIFVYIGYAHEGAVKNLSGKFYHYMYTDRNVYHRNDTINVFGIIRETNSIYRLNDRDEVTVSLGDMETAPLSLNKYGCFSHTFSVANKHGDAAVYVKINGEELMSATVSFAGDNKDKYLINAETDRHVYFADEQPALILNITTYDGAPAPGVELEVSTGLASYPQTVSTDANGLAFASLPIMSGRSQAPYLNGAYIATRGGEGFLQANTVPFIALNTGIMLEHEILPDQSVVFTSNSIDRDAIEKAYNSSGMNPYSPDVYRGAPVNLDFTLTINEVTLSKEKISERYDYVLGRNVPEYRSGLSENAIETRMLSTNNGALTLTGLPQSNDPNISYSGVISYKDNAGREVSYSIDLSGYAKPPSDGYTLDLMKSADALKIGEAASIQFLGGTDGLGSVMSVLANNGILSAAVGSPDNIPIVFSEDCMYSVQVFGAYFDGKYVYPAEQPLTVRFDASGQNLNILVESDKETYKPGDEALLDITVTDQWGIPKQAMVNISIVDEAAFGFDTFPALGFPDEFYGSIAKHKPGCDIYTSYGKLSRGVAAEPEGNTDSGIFYNNIRKESSDNPVFEILETDLQGKARLAVKLTETAARWRITSHAVSADNHVGSGIGYLAASLPFYVSMDLADEFANGDHINLVAKPGGSDFIYGENPVLYTLELKKDEGTLLSLTETQPGAVSFDLGALDTGEYSLNLTADMGTFTNNANTYTDTVEKVFRVSNTGVSMNLRVVKTLTADDPNIPSVALVEPPVDISLCNGEYAFILQTLTDVLYKQASTRTDHIAASAFASDYFNNKSKTHLLRIKDKIVWNDGIPEQLHGSGEPIYTARFAAAFPELIDVRQASAYAAPLLSDDGAFESNRAAGYFLLAAIGRSVLTDIDGQVMGLQNEKPDASLELAKLLYTAAYCAIGADDKAAALYQSYAGNAGNTELAEILSFYINTALDPAAAEDYLKTAGQNNVYINDLCERINYIGKTAPLSDQVMEASLNLDGNTEDITLKGYEAYNKSISAESFKSMVLKPVRGSMLLNIAYIGRAADLNPTQNIIGLEKAVLPVAGNENLFDIVFSVDLPKECSKGYYTIRDRVPGNMRFIYSKNPDNAYVIKYLDNQLVDIDFYYDGMQPDNLHYRVIKVSASDAVVERAYVSRDFMTDQPWGASN